MTGFIFIPNANQSTPSSRASALRPSVKLKYARGKSVLIGSTEVLPLVCWKQESPPHPYGFLFPPNKKESIPTYNHSFLWAKTQCASHEIDSWAHIPFCSPSSSSSSRWSCRNARNSISSKRSSERRWRSTEGEEDLRPLTDRPIDRRDLPTFFVHPIPRQTIANDIYLHTSLPVGWMGDYRSNGMNIEHIGHWASSPTELCYLWRAFSTFTDWWTIWEKM